MPNKYPTSSSTVHNRYLGAGGFKGVDFTSPPAFVSPDRFSDAKNVYKDYRSGLGACVETFPGYRNPFRFVGSDNKPVTIHGMVVWRVNGSGSLNGKTISNEDVVAIHAGTRLYIIPQRSVQGLAPDIELSSANTEYVTYDSIHFPTNSSPYLYQDFKFKMNGEEVASTVFCAVLPDEYKSFPNYVDFLPDEPCKMFYEDGDLYIISNHRDGEEVEFRSFETMYRVKMGKGRFTPKEGTIVDYLFSAEKVVATYRAFDAYSNVSLFTEGGYVPTLYINNEEYEQQNLLSASYSELFTSITVDRTAETGGGSNGDAAIDTWTCYPSSKACFTWSRGPDGAKFDGASVAIYVDGTRIFFGYSPTGLSGTGHPNVTAEFFYRGTKIESLNAPNDAASGTVPFDEIRITDEIKSKKILCTGATVKIAFDRQPDTSDFAQTSGLSALAVLGCRVVERHDGRIFFSGNPDYPNTVFYTHRDASTGANDITYVGASNYFKVGGGSAITALVSTTSSLVIFKEATGADGDSEIYYATGVMTQNDLIPKIYTVTQGATNVDSATAAFTFYDDVCFASASGIFGLNKLQTNLERSVQSRSNLINGRFVTEDPNVLLTVWNGYLCVYCKSGHMYLADSRQLSSDGYEWYYVDGIGYYSTHSIYKIDHSFAGSDIYDESGELIGTVSLGGSISSIDFKIGYLHQTVYNEKGDEETIKIKCRYFERVFVNGRRDLYVLKNVIERGRVDTSFVPATTMITVGDSIWFGANGSLLVLNSDLRGVPNNDDDAGVDPTRIRSKWYSQNGVAYESYVTTYYDDAGAPNLAKSTISRSTVIDMKTIPGSAFKVSVYTARDGWQTPVQSTSSIPDYSDSDFSNVSFDADMHTVVTLRERTNRWSRKMYRIYSDEICRPFGIHRISYQFKVAGRIKD